MVTEEIKTIFREANRQVDRKLWMKKGHEISKTRWVEERRPHPKRNTLLEGADWGQRVPAILSLWLKVALFKRIFHRLANLPATSSAEHNSANVMRVVALPPFQLDLLLGAQGSCSTPSWRMHSCTSSTTEWSSTSGQQRKIERPKHLFQSEMLPVILWGHRCYLAMAEYHVIISPKAKDLPLLFSL